MSTLPTSANRTCLHVCCMGWKAQVFVSTAATDHVCDFGSVDDPAVYQGELRMLLAWEVGRDRL